MSAKRVIFLNGPMGVGKTTVGRLLQKALYPSAFVDGDWCLDLEPFVGNPETRAMAADNILHLLKGYDRCLYCQSMVVSWLVDRPEICQALERGAREIGLETAWFTLLCTRQALESRWREDTRCPWRTEENLAISLRSLAVFSERPGVEIDTTGRTAEQVRDHILALLSKRLEGTAAESLA